MARLQIYDYLQISKVEKEIDIYVYAEIQPQKILPLYACPHSFPLNSLLAGSSMCFPVTYSKQCSR